jgi:hypothetical protein
MLFFVTGLAHAQLVANPDVFGVPFGQPLVVEPLGVLNNDTLDGQTDFGGTAELVTPVTNGTLNCVDADGNFVAAGLCPDGSFQYIPGPGFSGTASFTYRALDGTIPSTPATVTLTACTEVSPQVFSCWQESLYRAKLTELGYSTFLESFEGSAWDGVRSTFDTTNSAPEITSQGITWTSNHPLDTTITTGTGPALTGNWGAYDPDHGFATGSPTECNVDTPPPNCLFHDGLSGNVVASRESLHGAGGYITGFTGANIAIILDGTTEVNVGALPDAGFHFLGLIDARPPGFTSFEFRELDGKVGQERLIFGDDFIIASSGLASCNENMVSSVTATSVASYEACEILVVGPSFTAEDGASITLSSGWEIWLMPSFSINQGATLNANVCGQSLCAISLYPMPLGCHSCVDLICADTPSCCSEAFDAECLAKVNTICGLVCE